jgi:hypothetical protein
MKILRLAAVCVFFGFSAGAATFEIENAYTGTACTFVVNRTGGGGYAIFNIPANQFGSLSFFIDTNFIPLLRGSTINGSAMFGSVSITTTQSMKVIQYSTGQGPGYYLSYEQPTPPGMSVTDYSTPFYLGFGVGLVMFGVGWKLRLVKQGIGESSKNF